MTEKDLKILVVDDDAFVRDLLTEILISEGHTVISAENGAEAFTRFSEDRSFDLIMSDINMPVMTGLELIRKLRDAGMDVPLIVLTGNLEISTAIEAMLNGADDYVLKGEDIQDSLLLSMRRVLEKHAIIQQNKQLLIDLAAKNTILKGLNHSLENIVSKFTHIGVSLIAEQDLPSLLDKIVMIACEVTNADGASLYLLQDNQLHFRNVYNKSLDIHMGKEGQVSADFHPVAMDETNIAAYCAINKTILNIPDVYEYQEFNLSRFKVFDQARGYRTKSMLVIPMLNRNRKTVGALQLFNATDQDSGLVVEFPADRVEVVNSIASQAAVAIENNQLHEEQIRQEKIRNDFGIFYVVTMIVFALANTLPDMSDITGYKKILASWGALLALSVPLVYMIKRIGTPLREFGIAKQGWQRAVREGVIFSLILLPVLVLIKVLIGPDDEEFFSWKLTNHYNAWEFPLYLTMYFFHSFVQEFASRGIIQGSLQMFMKSSHYMIPIIVVALMFGVAHLHLSITAAALTTIVSIIFGCIYYRHKNLWGVTIVHYILGIMAMALGWV